MKLSFQEGLIRQKSFSGLLGQLKMWGFDAVEVWGEGLSDRLDEVKMAVKGADMPVSSICPGGGGIRGSLLDDDADSRAQAEKDIRALLEMGAELGAAGLIIVPEFGKEKFMALYPDHSDFQKRKEIFTERLAPLAARAVQLGVKILLEPLNRYEAFFLLTVRQGAELCRMMDSPAVRVMADFFHMGIEEDCLIKALEDNARWISHIHLVDTNRKLPGHGDRDFPKIIQSLKKTGFDGCLCLECGIPGENPGREVAEAAQFIKRLL